MNQKIKMERIETGVKNLDALLGGGLPVGSITVLGGTPGAGKTTLAQQICFKNASATKKVLFFQTLSEPSAKTMLYMSQFEFFDTDKLNNSVEFVDLGSILRSEGLEGTIKALFEHIKRVKPAFVVIDSFKVFDDLSETKEDMRKFTYDVAVRLMAWEVTGFLLGEYGQATLEDSPLSSVVDGILILNSQDSFGESQRFLKILKMRGTNHNRNSHSFSITDRGVEVYNSDQFVPESSHEAAAGAKVVRLKSGISGLDEIICGGFPPTSVSLVSGASGTGRTLFVLESLYRGALEQKQKGIFFSFEQTESQLITNASQMGWDLRPLIKSGLLRLVFLPQMQILIDRDLATIQEQIAETGATRVGIDSLTVLLEKIEKPHLLRKKVMQISAMIKSAGAMGLLVADIQFGTNRYFRRGSAESAPDGAIHLSSESDGRTRQRYLEVLKMRNTNHSKNRCLFSIETGGLQIHREPLSGGSPRKSSK